VRPLALDIVARAFGHPAPPDRRTRPVGGAGRAGEPGADAEAKPGAPLSDEKIASVLARLAEIVEGEPVYIWGGLLHRRLADGALTKEPHAAAGPYRWSLAHDVRPAAQSLGARGCTDCHAGDAPIFFGRAGPRPDGEALAFAPLQAVPMHEVHGYRGWLASAWGYLFALRPVFKALGLACVVLTALVLVQYGWAGLAAILRRLGA